MKAKEAKLLQILGAVSQFIIPIYQRTNSWTLKECQQLWADTQLARKASTSISACLRMALSVPSGISPA
jgi:uncharacterized protein with ParB-like and HNH nuclease domain